MKKIFILHYSMEIGGAESSLLGMLQSIDYSEYQVDLMLLNKCGELLELIPEEVNMLNTPRQYRNLVLPIKQVVKRGGFLVAGARLLGKLTAKIKSRNDMTYITKQYCHKYALPFLPVINGDYDMAISYIDPHFIIARKVKAEVKLAWLHTDFSRIDVDKKQDFDMWNSCDYIVTVSESCKEAFDKVYPYLHNKSFVMENILSKDFMIEQSNKYDVKNEMPKDKDIKLLSIGRFSPAKNFDNIPFVCKNIISQGVGIKWYIVGYGSEQAENEIRHNIKEAEVQGKVVILGKKDNPYPYIKACDIYVQPSRYEGKCVAVREAQILNKPVIITSYATSKSQLKDGYDGVIVPMDNDGCAEGIARVIRDKELQNKLIENTKENDYTNKDEINKLYKLMEC